MMMTTFWGKEQRHPLHLGVVAIEKGAFELPSTTVVNFTFLLPFYLLFIQLW